MFTPTKLAAHLAVAPPTKCSIRRACSYLLNLLFLMPSLITFIYCYLGQPQKQYNDIDLEELVNQIAQDYEIIIKEVGGSVLFNGDRKIKGDASQLRQVLKNLISNALKFHRKEVSPVVNIFCQIKKGFYEVSVQDNGIGFDDKFNEKIFQPFQRL